MKNKKILSRVRRHRRIRMRATGTLDRPRLVVRRSLKNIWAQLINDTEGKIILVCSTMDKEVKQRFPCAGNIKAAEFFGEVFARKAKEKGVSKIVFDRAGYLYHGRVKTFAEALRKGGLDF